MNWLIALVAAVVGFAGGFSTCIWLFGEFDDKYDYADYYEVDEWK